MTDAAISDAEDDAATLCADAYQASVRVYHSTVAASVVMALFCLSIRHVCLRDLGGAPALAAQFYTVVACLQLAIAVLDVTLFVPHCPEDCVAAAWCSNRYKTAYFVYPFLATALAAFLYREARHYRTKAQAVAAAASAEQQDALRGGVFQRIPEMELA